MKHVALLRAVNVAKRMLPMKDLAEIFVAAGCGDVLTYIQSGNVVFSAPPTILKKLPAVITERIEERFGFRVPVILRTRENLARTIRDNPFLREGKAEKTLHVYFLADTPSASAIESLDIERFLPDSFRASGSDVYLHLPNGMGRSKLTNAYFDSKLSTVSTARNWATVLKLFELTQE